MSTMRARLATLLIAPVLALGLAACGGDDSSGAAGNGTDKAFAEAMIPHHQGAIEMAKIAQQRGESEFVKTLAGEIISAQEREIATLRTELEALEDVEAADLGMSHSMTGMDGDTAMLKTADPFDPAFLKMMVPHHEGAIEMAEAQLQKGEDPELRKLAEEIIAAQKREIGEMQEQLQQAS
jgi:uncharacterized protein (DUF305 family)